MLFEKYTSSDEPMLMVAELPFIGPVTVYHLAKNFGSDTAKADVHMERLAGREKTTTHRMCRRLSRETGYRIATIDSVLWRACVRGGSWTLGWLMASTYIFYYFPLWKLKVSPKHGGERSR